MSPAHLMFSRISARTSLLAVLLSTLPLTVDLTFSEAGLVAVSEAAAKDGRDNSGSGSDSSGSGGDDDGGGDNSGSGSDSSGSGGDDDGGGDNSGSGSDDSGGDDSSGEGSDDDGGDDDGGSGRDGGGRDSSGPGRGGRNSGGSTDGRVNFRNDRIEVIYRGGWTEEIRDGRFKMKDPNGRTVVERGATAEDFARLQALAR